MVDERLSEQDRVVLEVVEVLGERAEHQAIKMMVREAFRRDLRAVLTDLTERDLLMRFPPGRYLLTRAGREALAS